MKPVAVSILLAASLLATLTGCGYIGAPQPPALNIPSTVVDLKATELGDQLLIQGTLPKLTTDGLPLTEARSMDLYIGVNSGTGVSIDQWAKTATRYERAAQAPGPFQYPIPIADWDGKLVTVAVRAIGPTGRPSGWSNVELVSVAMPLNRPVITIGDTAGGVRLTWTGNAPRYRIQRSIAGAEFQPAGEVDAPAFLDDSTLEGTLYRYIVTGFAGDKQQSQPSEAAAITPVDIFAPAVPTGLSAVPAGSSIELAWARNTEQDFRGYNLFRSIDGGASTNIAAILETPAYSDNSVQSGHRYRYTLSSVDGNGNESTQSMPVEVAVQ